MENNNIAKQDKDLSNKVQRNYVMTQVALRTLTFISTLSAALVMITNEQHKVVLGLSWNARYTYSAAFR
ncbi:CASP-like protein [Acorus calamus]|uniref:CASP-like protein n=1 Tax=Acorus calamus TaxID=4465 RepID=A0AAV9EEX8_ACOCL|nr:CASP-like protein [Acorus calamus]